MKAPVSRTGANKANRVRRRPPKSVEVEPGGLTVLQNRPFLLLWLAQASSQVGGNMVIYGLTIIISTSYASHTAVSALLLSFLLPAILFSALAGVFVDRVDKRHMLLVTNVLRGLAVLAVLLVGTNLAGLYLLMIFVATVTTFFGPAEASMIPFLVPRHQLLAANGLFTLTMNVAFALGFALVGPFLVALASAQLLIVIVAVLYFVAAVFCWTLPSDPPVSETAVSPGQTVADAERAVETMVSEFVEGMVYIRDHHNVGWSLSYLGITGALIGVLAVLGPGFAQSTLGLGPKDFGLIVLPIGLGIVTGILVLNSYGRYLPRRRTIEAGMVGMGLLLVLLSFASPLSGFLEAKATSNGLAEASQVVSLLSMVMGIAFLVGAAYSVVAISSQTQLQEELPEDVRGRVFGVLNMLVSISSLAPMIVAGAVADAVGVPAVILVVGAFVCLWGLGSFVGRGALLPEEAAARAPSTPSGAPVDPITAALLTGERAAGTVASTDNPPGPAAGHGSRHGLEDGEPRR
ncbi:MAG: MFS transporter [Candidatus Limnocylindrales bacterium]